MHPNLVHLELAVLPAITTETTAAPPTNDKTAAAVAATVDPPSTFSITASITALIKLPLIFLFLSISSLAIACLFDAFASQAPTEGIWHFQKFQLVFYVALLFSCAEITIRTHNSKGVLKPRESFFLPCLFVLAAVLVIFVPSLSEMATPPKFVTPLRGNCSDNLPGNLKNNCPNVKLGQFMLTPDKFQPGSEVGIHARDMFINLERATGAVQLLELVGEWWKTSPSKMPANIQGDYNRAHHFLNADCLYLMIDWMCSRLVTPCRFSDCNPVNATLCSVSYITNYLQCAKEKCREDLDSDCDPDDITQNLMYKVSRAVEKEISKNAALMSGNNEDLFKKIFEVLSLEISQYQQLLVVFDHANCEVESAGTVDAEPDADAKITTCNPSISNVTISTGATKRDGFYVLITTLATLGVVVSASSCSGMNVAEPHLIAIVNAAFGTISAIIVFVGGLNIERFANNSDEPRPDLVIWCCLYYGVSCAVFHHSLFFFLPEERLFQFDFWHLAYICYRRLRCKKPKDPEKKKKKKKSTIARLSWFRKNWMKVTGKYFIIYLWIKEVVQSIQQLVGITNSSDETEAFDAFLTTLLVALNMVLLPFMYHFVLHISGPTSATAVNIFLSTLIDKSFLSFSVFVRRTETAVGGKDFWEALLRHSLTLLPALMFVMKKDKYYQMQKVHTAHSMRQSQQELTHRRAGSNTKRGRRESLSESLDSKSHVVTSVMAVIGILVGLSLGIFSTLRFQNIQRECREQLGILADCASPRYYFKDGYFLGTPTCAIEDYVAFNCANGTLIDVDTLFDNSSVYADMVRLERIDVSGNRRLASLPRSWSAVPNDIVVLAARNPALTGVPYALCRKTMNITIDVSDTPFSKAVNWSEQILKDVPRNKHAYIKAFQGECVGTELQMYKGTDDNPGDDEATRAKACADACLNGSWLEFTALGFIVNTEGRCYCESQHSATCSREVRSSYFRYDFESRNLDISRSCLHSVRHAHTLDISNNELICGDKHCEFETTVQNLRNLSFLDIGRNEIKTIVGSLSSMTRNIQVKALEISRFPAINLVGNHIAFFNIKGESAGVLKSWFTAMRALKSVIEGHLQADLQASEFRELEIGKLRSLKKLHILGKNSVHDFDFLHISNIETLFLQGCNIDNAKAENLASALRQSKLKWLELYENTFGDSGALALAGSLKKSILQKLKISAHRGQFSAGFETNLSLPHQYCNSKGETVEIEIL